MRKLSQENARKYLEENNVPLRVICEADVIGAINTHVLKNFKPLLKKISRRNLKGFRFYYPAKSKYPYTYTSGCIVQLDCKDIGQIKAILNRLGFDVEIKFDTDVIHHSFTIKVLGV
jgi:hypothetical protein